MIDRTIARAGAASGIIYVLVIFTAPGLFGGDTGTRAELVAMLFFLPFLGYLWRVLGAAEGADGWLATTALGAGLVAITIKLASAAPLLAADFEADGTHLHDALIKINDVSFVLTQLPLGVMAAAVAVLTLTTGVLPRWLGWLALAAAPALIVNGLSFHSQDGPAFLLFALWLVATSVVLTLRAGRRPAAATDTQPANVRADAIET